MSKIKKYLSSVLVGILSLAMLVMPATADATNVTSTASSVSLSMTVSESVTLSATPSNITFNYSSANGGQATASGPITVSISYNLAASHTGVSAYAWLSSATAALSGPSNIPSTSVLASINSGTATACTGTIDDAVGVTGVAGAACGSVVDANGAGHAIFNVTAPPAGSGNGTVNLLLSMNSLGNLNPGSFAGVINCEAAAY